MFHHIVINTTEHDPMHVRMLFIDGVEEIAAAGANYQVVAIVLECGSENILYAQANLLWDEMIPARIMADNREEVAFVNSIIDSTLDGGSF